MRRNSGQILRPTIKDVAKQAGVSAMTVSRVVNQHDNVSEAARRAVNDAIAKLGYLPNKAAANLQSVSSHTVALLLPDLSHSLFHDMYRGLNSVMEEAGYLVLIGESHYDIAREAAMAKSMLAWRPDGFVFSNMLRDSTTLRLLKESGVPVCLLSDPELGSDKMVVGYSSYRIGAAVARFLFRMGRKRLGFVRSTQPYTRNTERMLDGARSVLAEFPTHAIEMIGMPKTSPLTFEDGAAVVRSLHDGTRTACDALMFANDVPATGAVLECLRRGIRVPDELAIVGFGDSELAAQISPALTTVHIDSQSMGRAAGRLLLAHMHQDDWKPRAEEIEFRLVLRDTT
ncbi:MAG: LacI family DNA-binding transcriptional regulator [Pseudomonadota bacterium]|jgi:LacI family gluconate utilization system Gnt-I transcriptional repressor